MKRIDKELIDELPSSFMTLLVDNLVEMAKRAEKDQISASLAYTMTEDVSQRNHAIHANAKYETCRDVLLMLGKTNALKSGETYE